MTEMLGICPCGSKTREKEEGKSERGRKGNPKALNFIHGYHKKKKGEDYTITITTTSTFTATATVAATSTIPAVPDSNGSMPYSSILPAQRGVDTMTGVLGSHMS